MSENNHDEQQVLPETDPTLPVEPQPIPAPAAPALARTPDFIPLPQVPDPGTPWVVGAGHFSVNSAQVREQPADEPADEQVLAS